MLAAMFSLASLASCSAGAPTIAAIADAGTGGADGSVAAACAILAAPSDPTFVLDDFEDGSSALPLIAGRVGSWYAEGDATPGAIVQPNGLATPELIPGGRCGSRRALHVTGVGFFGWGSEVSAPLHYGPDDAGVSGFLPYDASGYQGVTFFARIGDTSAAQVRVSFADERARPEAGLCVVDGPPGQGCYDSFGVDLPGLGTEWQAYRIPFAGLSQRNFGVHGDRLDTANLYDIAFIFPPGIVFDLWIDDIDLYE